MVITTPAEPVSTIIMIRLRDRIIMTVETDRIDLGSVQPWNMYNSIINSAIAGEMSPIPII